MCVGWAVGDVLYVTPADPLGSSEPFGDWQELSLAVVTFNMAVPMITSMRFRGMHQRPTAELAAAMVVLALLILVAGWLGIYTGHEMGAHR